MMKHLSITTLTCSALIALTNPVKTDDLDLIDRGNI